jgi:chromosome partitioning protein
MVTCTIAIATHKGGTGKTVTAMALSAALARAGQTCLLVDLDPQGHSTLGLGVELAEGEPTLHACFSEPALPLSRVIRTTHLPGLHLAPANLRLARVAQALYMRPKREEVLRRAFEPMATQYAYIVLDCPPALGALTEAALTAADLILIPCQLEARAADGLVDLLEVMGILKGEAFAHWRILLTKVDRRKTTTNQAVLAALAPWQHKLLTTTIPQSEPLNQAQIERTDIFSFEPKSQGALAYAALAEEIMRYVREKEPPHGPRRRHRAAAPPRPTP